MNAYVSALDRGALPAPDDFYQKNVERYRRSGNRARGVCPFHYSPHRGRFCSTPLSIDLTRGLWHCFVCDLGGDILSFVMLRDNCSFIVAARRLGVLRSMSQTEVELYQHERQAQQERQRRREAEFCEHLQLLLREMEIYEATRDWAFEHHHDEVQDLAEELIDRVGGEYILLKAGML
jgi:DNA primase